jgi:hypothetical protein
VGASQPRGRASCLGWRWQQPSNTHTHRGVKRSSSTDAQCVWCGDMQVMAAIGEEPEILFLLPKHQVRANNVDVARLPIDLQNLLDWATRQRDAMA